MLTAGTDVATANVFTSGLVLAGSDRVNALQDEDVLTGTGTNATLNATLGNANDNGGTTIAPVLSNIETVNVRFTGAGAATVQANDAVNALDLQNTTGVKNINVTGISAGAGASAVSFLNAAEASTNNFSIAAVSVPTRVNFDFQDGVLAGAADTGSVAVRGVTLTNLAINNRANATTLVNNVAVDAITSTEGFETLTLNSVGSANTIELLSATQLRNLNITGDRALTLANLTQQAERQVLGAQAINNDGAGNFVLENVNASALTVGSLTIDLSGHVGEQPDPTNSGRLFFLNAVGSAQADTFFVKSAIEDSNIKIDGGAGRDTLKLFANLTDSSATPTRLTQVTNLEVLEARNQTDAGSTITVDTDLITNLDTIVVRNESAVAGDDIFNLNNVALTAADEVIIEHGTTGNNATGRTVVNVEIRAATGASDTGVAVLKQALNTDLRFNSTLKFFGELTSAEQVQLANLQADPTNNLTVAQVQTNFVNARRVENLTINDTDNESNTVKLLQKQTFGPVEQTNINGTLSITGGQNGQFMNLDATANAYRYAQNGSTDDGVHGAPGVRTEGDAANAAIERLTTQTIDSSNYAGNVIVRVGNPGAAENPANVNGAQTVRFGAGNDTLIFDQLGTSNAGLSLADTLSGGAGNDILAIDGNNLNRVTIQTTELQNVTGFEVLRLLTNAATAGLTQAELLGNPVNGAAINTVNINSYNITLGDGYLSRNAADGKILTIINDNNGLNDDGVITAAEQDVETKALAAGVSTVVSQNSGVTIDARILTAGFGFNYNGEETTGNSVNGNGAFAARTSTADRFIFTETNLNAASTIDGGRILNAYDAALRSFAASNQANADVLEIRNAAQVTTADLANISNVGTLQFTNDSNSVQTSDLALNNDVVDRLVNTSRAVGSMQTRDANMVETLQIQAFDAPNAATALRLDTTGLTGVNLQLNIAAAGGNDVLNGGAGNDTISGGAGNDTINGGAGDDVITSGAGNDNITGGAGADVINGGDDLDTYTAGDGTSISVTLNGANQVTVTVTGGTNDTISNIENVIGTAGADTIVGDALANVIDGGAGADAITGGAGGDSLTGGAGADTFTATTRAESFIVGNNANFGTDFDQITDFLSGTDKLNLNGDLVATPLTVAVDANANLNANTQAFNTDFATTAAAAITALGANAFANANDVIVLTITGGTAAQNGVYVLQNLANAGFAAADDLVLKLVGTSSTTLVAADFI